MDELANNRHPKIKRLRWKFVHNLAWRHSD